MTRADEGIPTSVQVRLARHARANGMSPNVVLARFAAERFLYRLSRSPHGSRFVLKGALLMLAWLGETIRPTRDADLLGFGDLSAESLTSILGDVCAVVVEPDGLEFLPASIRTQGLRAQNVYGGLEATLDGRLGKARLRVHIDVGIGDAVTPEPEWIEYPSLLEFPRPRLRAYRPETTIAEKVHAMVVLAEANSRMRDFFDIHALAARMDFDGPVLADAVAATFARRRTPIPKALPVALTTDFARIEGKAAQWAGFVRRLPGTSAPQALDAVLGEVSEFAGPVLLAAARGKPFDRSWKAGGPWR